LAAMQRGGQSVFSLQVNAVARLSRDYHVAECDKRSPCVSMIYED
jgi:hypothetical protein